jgi:hypothetical protein
MAQDLHCWRCRMVVPMLNEEEWAKMGPLLSEAHKPEAHNAALALYEELTGSRETNINAVSHHRVSLYGPACDQCGKPLRTPRARFCAACGESRCQNS